MTELTRSFSSANVFPAKVLRHEKLLKSCLNDRKVLPIHVQLNPTNLCQFNCGFCSCSGRDKTLELSYHETIDVALQISRAGCESVTLTGGGDPLLFTWLSLLLTYLQQRNIKVGLVTNGVLLYRLRSENIPTENIVWCRISSSDHVPTQLKSIGLKVDDWLDTIVTACEAHPHIDWAFSHVLTHTAATDFLEQVIGLANCYDFTHVRIVSNIFDPLPIRMQMLKDRLHCRIDDSKVIYQARTEWTHGQNPCYISLLKPVIGADGYIYPCCGTQYALKNPTRDYEPTMRMGTAEDLEDIVEKQAFFDGSNCVKCYYANYNWALGVLLSKLKHEEFV